MARPTLWIAASLLTTALSETYTGPRPFDTCLWNPPGPLHSLAPTICPPLHNFDEVTAHQTNTTGPWSLRPYCLRAANNPQAKYCVFTTHLFKGHHSTSIITTPKIASLLAPALHSPLYEWEAGSPSPLPAHVRLTEAEAESFEVRDLPGRGKGVVARRVIRRGEVVMVGYPSLIGRMRFSKAVDAEQGRRLIGRAVEQLPEVDREEIMRLARSTGGEFAVEDVLRTNIFGVDLGGSRHFGLFPSLSRMNHACEPNAVTRFIQRSMTMDVVAYQDIQPGDEILISYTPFGLPYDRRTSLIRAWNFTCTCPLCTDPDLRSQSDTRRRRIRTIRAELDADAPPPHARAVALADEFLGLLEEEKLWSQMAEDYETLASLFHELGDPRRAKRYTEMAVEKWREYGGGTEGHPHLVMARWFLWKLKREFGDID